MAEQTKQTEEVVRTLTEEEKRFNRRVNYFIMRYMWQVVRGRKRDDGDTIYAKFDTSRERFTRVINTGVIRYGKGELDGLEQHTGLRKEIFTGEVRFSCPYVLATKEGKVKTTISTEDWEKVFRWRDGGKNEPAPTEGKKVKSPQDRACEILRKVRRNDVNNWDFYRLCYYLKTLEAAPLRMSAGKVREIETAIRGLSFSLLNGCQVGQLQKLHELLEDKCSLVGAMVVCKNAEETERESKK